MKYCLVLLLVVVVTACSDDKHDAGNGGGDGFSGGGSGMGSSQPALNDSREVAWMRQALVQEINSQRTKLKQQFKDQDLPPDMGEKADQLFGELANKIAITPASSTEELKNLTQSELGKTMKQAMAMATAKITANAPKRIGPEPKPGEKRDAVDASGNCTNDLMVDMTNFALKAAAMAGTIAELASENPPNPQKLKVLFSGIVNDCDTIVDRYGDTAVCKQTTGTMEIVRMSEFKDKCTDARRQLDGI